jgi:hypothetical protein
VHSLDTNYSRNRDGFIFDGATLPDFSFNQVQVASVALPEDIRLSQVYPLPCTSESKIDVTLTEDQPIRLLVTDITGAQIAILHDGMETRGTHTYSFASISLHSGTYLCVLSAGGSVRSSKLLIVK